MDFTSLVLSLTHQNFRLKCAFDVSWGCIQLLADSLILYTASFGELVKYQKYPCGDTFKQSYQRQVCRQLCHSSLRELQQETYLHTQYATKANVVFANLKCCLINSLKTPKSAWGPSTLTYYEMSVWNLEQNIVNLLKILMN